MPDKTKIGSTPMKILTNIPSTTSRQLQPTSAILVFTLSRSQDLMTGPTAEPRTSAPTDKSSFIYPVFLSIN
jgi:hypothetical protein